MKLLFSSIVNGIIASILSWLILIPNMWLVVFLFSFNALETTTSILELLDIIVVIAIIGAFFEIANRIYIGKKHNCIVGIIRKKREQC